MQIALSLSLPAVAATRKKGVTPIPPTGPPPDGYAYVADITTTPILYEVTDAGDYIIAPIEV